MDFTGHTALTAADRFGYEQAYLAAAAGGAQGGVPIGSSLMEGSELIAAGHNRRVQDSDPTAHAEITALRAAGRRGSYRNLTLFTTLAPCALCSGAIVQFKVPRVVVGESRNFSGELEFLARRGVEVIVLDDPQATNLMQKFIAANPTLWNEDIAE
ncbi:nucleoside deaminase [Glutamicibacter soli]|uniref:nucleoside deaminase n=1 Tax=Glutamicibacter soli TaxID=453836 RepID=UPI003C70B709